MATAHAMTATPRPRALQQRTPSPSEVLLGAELDVSVEELVGRTADLLDIATALAAASGTREVGAVALERGLRLVDAVAGTIAWREAPGEIEIIHALGLPAVEARGRRRLADALPECAALRSGAAVFAGSRDEIARAFPGLLAESDAAGATAWAAAPMILDGAPAGALAAGFTTGRAAGRTERALLAALAQACAPALARARLHELERKRREAAERSSARLGALQSITAALGAAETRVDVARVLLGERLASVGAAWGVLGWKVASGLYVADAPATPPSLRGATLQLGAPLSLTLAARTGKAVWMRTRDEVRALYPRLLDRFAPCVPGAVCTLPVVGDGARLGALGFAFVDPQPFDDEQRALLAAVAAECGRALHCAGLREDARPAAGGEVSPSPRAR